MKKFEYVYYTLPAGEFLNKLNQRGDEGWELVESKYVHSGLGSYLCLFKREKQ